MSGFERFTAPAFLLPDADIDTDIIFPARFLLHTEKRGLGRYAFHDRPAIRNAYEAAGSSPILFAGPNFGCGSSREHAVWALAGLGIRAVFAPSFGDIFRGNCANNGIVAGIVEDGLLAAVLGPVTVDLETRALTGQAGTVPFTIGDSDREMLLAGWNATTRILARHGPEIDTFEASQRVAAPWLWTKDTRI